MASRLTDTLLERAKQWQAFHEWEQNQSSRTISVEERIAWYAAAFDFVRRLPGGGKRADLQDKIDRIRNLHAHLKHLSQSGRNA
jgi:hypothetical protein